MHRAWNVMVHTRGAAERAARATTVVGLGRLPLASLECFRRPVQVRVDVAQDGDHGATPDNPAMHSPRGSIRCRVINSSVMLASRAGSRRGAADQPEAIRRNGAHEVGDVCTISKTSSLKRAAPSNSQRRVVQEVRRNDEMPSGGFRTRQQAQDLGEASADGRRRRRRPVPVQMSFSAEPRT